MTDIDDIKIRRLDLTLLLIFRGVVREGRTTLAAKRLGLSQSAISHALARLRTIYDDPLFIRRPDGLEPTARSLALLPKVEALIDLARDTLDAADRFDPATTSRTFRLAGNDHVAALIAAPLAKDLSEVAPLARLTFRASVGRESLEALRRSHLDLAVGALPLAPDGFQAEPLFEERFVTIARQGHPRLENGLDLDLYVDLDHLLVSFVGGFDGRVDETLRRLGRSRRVAVSVPMFFAAFATVAGSDYIATVPRGLAELHAGAFGLRILPCPVDVETYRILAVRHARAARDPALDWLIGRIRRNLPNDAGSAN